VHFPKIYHQTKLQDPLLNSSNIISNATVHSAITFVEMVSSTMKISIMPADETGSKQIVGWKNTLMRFQQEFLFLETEKWISEYN